MNEKLTMTGTEATGRDLANFANKAFDAKRDAEGNVANLKAAKGLGAVVSDELMHGHEETVRRENDRFESLVEAAGLYLDEQPNSLETILPTADKLREQLKAAVTATNEVGAVLGIDTLTKENAKKLLEHRLSMWAENGTLEYLQNQLEQGRTFTLELVPNVEVEAEDIGKLGEEFGKGQPYESYVNLAVHKENTPEELSGKLEGDATHRVRVVFDDFEPAAGEKDVPTQRVWLEGQQNKQPELALHSLSPLEGQVHNYTVRAAGKPLNWGTTYSRTIEAEPVQLGGAWSYVPHALVNVDGRAYVADSHVDRKGGLRVSVGKNLST